MGVRKMKFNVSVDSFVCGSKSHYICEDYAIHYSDPNGNFCLAIVCDGCSSSAHTDVGARIIAHIIKKYMVDRLSWGMYPDWSEIWKATLKKSIEISHILNIGENDIACLFSTALILFSFKECVHIYIYGDGSFVRSFNDGGYVIDTIIPPQNAPDYMIYQYDYTLRSKYLEMVAGEYSKIQTTFIHKNWSNTVIEENIMEEKIWTDRPVVYTYPLKTKKIKDISIFSDGIGSFIKPNAENLSIINNVQALHSFKSYTGDFVKKRCKGFMRECNTNGYSNADDFSMATIHIEYEE